MPPETKEILAHIYYYVNEFKFEVPGSVRSEESPVSGINTRPDRVIRKYPSAGIRRERVVQIDGSERFCVAAGHGDL